MTKLEDISWVSNIKVVDKDTDPESFPKIAHWIAMFPDHSKNYCSLTMTNVRFDKHSNTWSGTPIIFGSRFIMTPGNHNLKTIFYSEDLDSAKRFLNIINSIPDGNYKDIIGNIQRVNNDIKDLRNKIISLNRANTVLTKLFTNPG